MNMKLLSAALLVSGLLMLASSNSMAVFPGGMFLHPETVSASNLSSHLEANSGYNLALSAGIPSGIFVPDNEVVWQVRALDGGKPHQLVGNGQHLSLPDGKYEVSLLIGGYQQRTEVSVQPGQRAAPPFDVKIGRLQAFSGMPARWDVYRLEGGIASHQIISRPNTQQINEVLPVGEYEMRVSLDNSSVRQRVNVQAGQMAVANVTVPTGKVSLVATLNDGPAMRPMSWKVYSLEGPRREIAVSMRHSTVLVVAPGRYEAVATLGGVERRREFTVHNGSANDVVLAMD